MLKHDERLLGVSQRLIDVVHHAAVALPFDLLVVEGVRTLERQKQLYAQGRTVPGPVVTWTMNSKHIKQGDNLGHAVDLCAVEGTTLHWDRAEIVAKAMLQASRDLGIPIRWGADWNQNGRPHEKGETDSPHFELA